MASLIVIDTERTSNFKQAFANMAAASEQKIGKLAKAPKCTDCLMEYSNYLCI